MKNVWFLCHSNYKKRIWKYIANNLNILETKGWVYPSTAREAIRQYQHNRLAEKKMTRNTSSTVKQFMCELNVVSNCLSLISLLNQITKDDIVVKLA